MANRSKPNIDCFRDIVAHHQHAKIKGVHVDGFTASMVCQVYDAMNESNQAKYGAMTPLQMIDIGWKLVARSKT